MKTFQSAKDRVIVALDTPSLEKALIWAKDLAPLVGYFKVGLELLTAHGAPTVVRELHKVGARIFFDGKFNDIPNTISGAVAAVSKLGVEMFDVHASIGKEAMKAAAAQKGKSKALAVTILTSLDDDASRKIFGAAAEQKVLQFALEAAECGMDGIVCSPKELHLFQSQPTLASLWKVTPGVRPTWAVTDDQKRHLTPGDAIAQGATHLVIGRPITEPPAQVGGPVEAAKRILDELESQGATK
jgi:orotidine-5'-phosphate decarboxylase